MFKKVENFFTSSYLVISRFSRVERRAREIIKESIKATEFEIRFTKGKLFILAFHPSMQSELFLRREELLKKLQEHFGKRAVESVTIQRF